MTPQCHGGGRSSFSDLQDVAIEVVRADNLMAKIAIELHFVLHVESSLAVGSWFPRRAGGQKMSEIEIFQQLHGG